MSLTLAWKLELLVSLVLNRFDCWQVETERETVIGIEAWNHGTSASVSEGGRRDVRLACGKIGGHIDRTDTASRTT